MSVARKMTRRQKQRKAKRQQRLAATRPRYDLYLDKRKSEDAAVADLAERLLSRNKFSATARRGLLIDADLQAGNIDMLLKYHPEIMDKFRNLIHREDDDDLKKLVEAQAKQIETLTNVIEGLRLPATSLVASPAIKPLSTFKPLAPIEDDDSALLVKKKDESASGNITLNFLKSAWGSAGHDISDYISEAPEPVPKGIKSINAPKIAMPSFDDDEDFPVVKH